MHRDEPRQDERRPALVLGGGGAFGVVQAAYIQAIHEAGFRPSMVVGTSVGALNGAWVAMYPDDPKGLVEIWHDLEAIRLVRVNPVRLARTLIRRPLGISTNEIVSRLIERHVRDLRFEDTKLPLAIVATNLLKAEKHVFHSGALGPAILASTAIPGLFDPVEVDGELFLDGGLAASVDLATALAMGATEILAIELSRPTTYRRPRTALGVLRCSLGILASSSTNAMEACVAHHTPLRVIRPDLSAHSPWRLEDCASAAEQNLELARAAMASSIDARGRVIPQAPEVSFGRVPQVFEDGPRLPSHGLQGLAARLFPARPRRQVT